MWGSIWLLVAAGCQPGTEPGDEPDQAPDCCHPTDGVGAAPPIVGEAWGEPARPGSMGQGDDALFAFERPPVNLVMLSIDTLRIDRMGPQPDGSSSTPFLDAMRSDGVDLQAHQSCSSWTYPSVACALAGRSMADIGFVPSVSIDWEPAPQDTRYLAEMLEDAGYATGLITANGFLCDRANIGDGYQDSRCRTPRPAEDIRVEGEELLGELISSGSPWFLHLHFVDPHMAYDPPAAYLGAVWDLPPPPADLSTIDGTRAVEQLMPTLSAEDAELLQRHIDLRYAAELAYLDDQLGMLWAAMTARGALEDTLVVVWSDHGEQLMDHGRIGHGYSLHGEETDALAFFWASALQPGVWTQDTEHRDLVPTILELLQVDQPPDLSGRPIGTDEGSPAFAVLLRDEWGAFQSVTHEDLRLIYHWGSGDRVLYDVAADPGEQRDIYDAESPEVAALWRMLEPEIWALQSVIGGTPTNPGP